MNVLFAIFDGRRCNVVSSLGLRTFSPLRHYQYATKRFFINISYFRERVEHGRRTRIGGSFENSLVRGRYIETDREVGRTCTELIVVRSC